jgi:hypothetical protein
MELMKNDVHKILYCSRNLIEGATAARDAEIQQILEVSRVNNSRDDVTGALLFNAGWFAQVLEGPKPAIERVFERIQRDARHGDVTVLKCGEVGPRDFAEWSMAHVQPLSEHSSESMREALDAAWLHPQNSGDQVLELLRTLVVQED